MTQRDERKDQDEAGKDLIDKSEWFVLVGGKNEGFGLVTKEPGPKDVAFAIAVLQRELIAALDRAKNSLANTKCFDA